MPGEIIIKANWDWRAAKAMLRKMSGPQALRAMSVAVNDTARQVERYAERLTSKTLSIPAKRAKLGIWIRPMSTAQTLTATVRGSGSLIPLKAFGAKEAGSGVDARIWGEKRHYAGAFTHGGLPGKRVDIGMGGHVFRRAGKARMPIEKVPGASISEAMAKDAVSSANETYGVERLQVNVLRQLTRYSSAYRAGPRRGGKR